VLDGWILYHLLLPHVLHENTYAIQTHVNVIMLHHCTPAVFSCLSSAALFPSFKQNLTFFLCLSTGAVKLPQKQVKGYCREKQSRSEHVKICTVVGE
jgi:hypothetical protein